MSFWTLIKLEFKAIFANPVVVLTVFGGVVFYSLLYPLPYQQQTPQQQKIAIVNLDQTATSYRLERMVDATPQVQVIKRMHSIARAKQSFLDGEISGLLVIPKDFYKHLMLGSSPTLSYAGDASYFLVYGTVVEGLAKAGGTLAAQAKVTRLLNDGVPLERASQQFAPTTLNLKPTFNPQMGYLDYVVPAVFVLILQQTLVMATGLMVGTQRNNDGYWRNTSPIKLMAVRSFVFVCIYYVLAMFYFGSRFAALDVNRLASISELITFILPFFLASSFIGIWLGALTPRRELVTVVVLVSSMPLIFSAGFIWPVESIPNFIVVASQFFPSTSAITGLLRLNQMGSEWGQIALPYIILWTLVIFWGILAYLQLKRQFRSVH